VVTGVVRPSGPAPWLNIDVKYTVAAVFTMGGRGHMTLDTPTTPVREFDGINYLDRSAETGDPATITISPNGDIKLFVWTEAWAQTDCL